MIFKSSLWLTKPEKRISAAGFGNKALSGEEKGREGGFLYIYFFNFHCDTDIYIYNALTGENHNPLLKEAKRSPPGIF